MNTEKSQQLFSEALEVLPGGVDSPVRAFRAVGGQPLFIKRGEGAYLFDVDGNRFVDYVLSWGPLILGHAHKRHSERYKLRCSECSRIGTRAPDPFGYAWH